LPEDLSESEDGSGKSSTDESADEEQAKLVRRLDRCLKPLSYIRTNHAVHKYFRQSASFSTSDGQRGVSPDEAVEMSWKVAKRLGVPTDIFRGLPTVFERFDWDGDNLLNMQECTRMCRKMLRQRRKALGGRKEPVDVPFSSVDAKGYQVERELGRGGQGVMYLCTKEGSNRPYCVKFYSKEDNGNDDIDDIIEEFVMMKELSNQHIAKTYEVFQDASFYYLVNEPYFGGDLTKLALRAHKEGVRMSEAWWRKVFWQCLDGLGYLHSRAIIHCDIKEANIMIASGTSYKAPRVVLIDFGLSADFSSTSKGASGTPGYIPPETYESGWWYPRGDVFSMGITFFQLMVGQVPADDNSVAGVLQISGRTQTIIEATKEVQIPWGRFPANMPKALDLVMRMTHKQRYQRPSAHQALEHEWFESKSDAKLPDATLQGLLGTSAAHCAQEELVTQLHRENNLQELRRLHSRLRAADPTGQGAVPEAHATQVLQDHGATGEASQEFSQAHAREGGAVHYHQLMWEALKLKAHYNRHLIREVFDELDADGSGWLSKEELSMLIESEAFDCPFEDIEGLMDEMDTDRDGQVSFEEFARVMLKDGRVGRRSVARRQRPCHCM